LAVVELELSFFQFALNMTLITRLGAVVLLFVSTIPLVAADHGCKNSEFWYDKKGACLPDGGPTWSPSPPAGKQCPPSGWSWSNDHGCCVPHYPQPPSSPPPQCSGGWGWSSDLSCCRSPPNPPPPTPSGSYQKRSVPKQFSNGFCPMGMTACPIPGPSGLTGEFECLDTTNELESCGGCASIGEGQDCSDIRGAWNVACEKGRCAVYTCAGGFRRASNGKSCIEL